MTVLMKRAQRQQYGTLTLHSQVDATRNKCHASSNKCLTSSNKKLLGAPGRTTRSKDATRCFSARCQLLTNFYASTEEGELILGDWAARGEEDMS